MLREQDVDLVLQDMNFSRAPPGEEGLALLAETRRLRPRLPVILITAWGSIALAVEGMKAGAADFVTKPWTNAQLLQTVETALSLARQGTPATARRQSGAGEPRGARPALRLPRHGRRRAALPEAPRADRPGGADRRLGADHRRERHRQGAGRRGDPPQQPAARRAVRQGEPGRHLVDAVRERDVRPRQRRLHRRPGGPQGPLRDGRPRHDLPRRDRRARPLLAGEAAARAAGPLLRGAGVEHRRARSTCGWSRPPTATSGRWWRRGSSARTSSTA